MIPAGVLRNMQKTMTRSLQQVGAVYRPALEDVDGDTKKVYLPVSGLERVACDVMMPRAQRIAQDGEKLQPAHDRVIEFALGTDVKPGDLIRVDGQVWEVIGTDAGRGNPLSLRCEATSDLQGRI